MAAARVSAVHADVAIWGITNPRAAVNLRRIAAACVETGLRTQLLWWRGKGRAARTPEDYPVSGLEFSCVPFRYDLGVIRHPNPLSLLVLSGQVRRWLELNPVGAVVTQLDHGQVDRVWQYAAKRAGIPGVVVQEGMVNVRKQGSEVGGGNASDGGAWLRKRGLHRWIGMVPHPLLRVCMPYMYATYACVWGEAMKRHLVKAGRDPGTIFVTGSPAFDHLTGRAPLRPPEHGRVLFAQQRMGMSWDERQPLYQHLIRVVTQEVGCQLWFKLHPNSLGEAPMVRALVRAVGCSDSQCTVLEAGDAVDLLDQVDAIIVGTSTTSYHAAAAGVPVVFAEFHSQDLAVESGAGAGGVVAGKPDELADAVRRAVFDVGFRERLYTSSARWLEDHLSTFDGRASARVAGVVAGLAHELAGEG